MTIEEIRANAPSGATYYHDVCGRLIRYVKFKHGQAYYYDTRFKDWFCYNIPYEIKPL